MPSRPEEAHRDPRRRPSPGRRPPVHAPPIAAGHPPARDDPPRARRGGHRPTGLAPWLGPPGAARHPVPRGARAVGPQAPRPPGRHPRPPGRSRPRWTRAGWSHTAASRTGSAWRRRRAGTRRSRVSRVGGDDGDELLVERIGPRPAPDGGHPRGVAARAGPRGPRARDRAPRAALGVTPASVTIRDTTTRWGSCSRKGALSFSWRLVLAPPEALDAVAAHELCHLRVFGHSQAVLDAAGDARPRSRHLAPLAPPARPGAPRRARLSPGAKSAPWDDDDREDNSRGQVVRHRHAREQPRHRIVPSRGPMSPRFSVALAASLALVVVAACSGRRARPSRPGHPRGPRSRSHSRRGPVAARRSRSHQHAGHRRCGRRCRRPRAHDRDPGRRHDRGHAQGSGGQGLAPRRLGHRRAGRRALGDRGGDRRHRARDHGHRDPRRSRSRTCWTSPGSTTAPRRPAAAIPRCRCAWTPTGSGCRRATACSRSASISPRPRSPS